MYLNPEWAARLAVPPLPDRVEKWERTWKAHHGRMIDLIYQLRESDLTIQERQMTRAALSATRKILQGMEPPMIHRRQAHARIHRCQGRRWRPLI